MKDKDINHSYQNAEIGLNFNEFPVLSPEIWRQEAEKQLKGESFDKKLIGETYEDIQIKPIYTDEDIENIAYKNNCPGGSPFLRGNNPAGYVIKPWEIIQEYGYFSTNDCNKAITDDAKRKSGSISIQLDKPTLLTQYPYQAGIGEIGKGGLSISTIADFAKALADVDIENVPIYISAGISALPLMSLFIAYVKRKGLNINSIRGGLSADPLAELISGGTPPASLEQAYKEMAWLTRWADSNMPKFKTISIDSSPWHNSGASATEELAFSLSTAVEYLRILTANNLPVDKITSQMRFSYSLGSHFFMEIAKLRAARVLWSKIIASCGGDEEAQKMTIHARTSAYNVTAYDPHVNILRAATEAFSGIAGGCDSLQVGYFDEAIGQPDDFSRRLAANIQIILQQECHFDKVIDPAGGSWYVEKLTDEVAQKAWRLFQEIEAKGGMLEALKDGIPQNIVAKTGTARLANLAKGKDVLIGTNAYPNPSEKMPHQKPPDYAAIYAERLKNLEAFRSGIEIKAKDDALKRLSLAADSSANNIIENAIDAAGYGATLAEIAQAIRPDKFQKISVTSIKIQRSAEMFETIRKAAENYEIKTSSLPRVFLANFGTIAQYKPRSDFATGFFQTGGFEVVDGKGYKTINEASSAALEANADIVVICSADSAYPKFAPSLAAKIKNDKPDTIILWAGNPKEFAETYKKAGIDEFIYKGANIAELLLQFAKKLGVIS